MCGLNIPDISKLLLSLNEAASCIGARVWRLQTALRDGGAAGGGGKCCAFTPVDYESTVTHSTCRSL